MLMLYDGAIRFCREGADAMEKDDYDLSFASLTRSGLIIDELAKSMRDDVYPEMIANVRRLLGFAYTRIAEGNLAQEPALIDEAATVLNDLREMWGEAVQRSRSEASDESDDQLERRVELSA